MNKAEAFWTLWIMAFFAAEFFWLDRGESLSSNVNEFREAGFFFRSIFFVGLSWLWFHFDSLGYLAELYGRVRR